MGHRGAIIRDEARLTHTVARPSPSTDRLWACVCVDTRGLRRSTRQQDKNILSIDGNTGEGLRLDFVKKPRAEHTRAGNCRSEHNL